MIVSNTIVSLQPVIDELTTICGNQFVLTDEDDLYSYGKDETLNLHVSFEVLDKAVECLGRLHWHT